MDKWHFYGTLEMDAPYAMHNEKCIVCGIKFLHNITGDMLVAISNNK